MNISRLLMLTVFFFVACQDVQAMELQKRKAMQSEQQGKQTYSQPDKKELLEEKAAFAALSDFEKAYHLLGSSPEFKNCSLYDGPEDSLFQLCLEKLLTQRDENGNTLLHHAAKQNNVEYAKRFIRMGLAIDVENAEWKTPLVLSKEAENIEVLTLLQANENLLFYCYSLKILEMALQAGAYVNVRDEIGHTPLLRVADSILNDGGIQLITKLLDAGASVNVRTNGSGNTPLHNAAYHKHVKTVRLLLDTRADKNMKNCHGKTALDLARERQDTEVAALLENYPQ